MRRSGWFTMTALPLRPRSRKYRIHDRKRDLANHEMPTVLAFDGREATLKFDCGKTAKGPLSPHLDLGYCSTSFGAQGATVDRVIANLDSMRSQRLVNQRAFYVTLSRSRAHCVATGLPGSERDRGREKE
jgi:hypothetical protein